jgi:hypothetical protein
MNQSVTQWVNSVAGSNAALDWITTIASQFGVPVLTLLLPCNGEAIASGI